MITATAATPPRPSAIERVGALLPDATLKAVPREVLATRVGRGTVASELDRALRVGFVGDGPVSSRRIVPETTAAAQLLASPGGAAFERGIRSFVGVADAYKGRENIRTVTLYPDEHSVKAGDVVDLLSAMHADGVDTSPVSAHAREFVLDQAKDVPSHVRFSAARNLDGHIAVMPDVAREYLTTLGLYRLQPGDGAVRAPVALRDDLARESWRTMVHETHHSVTPQPNSPLEHESTSVMEEAVPSVLERTQASAIAKRAGADMSLAQRPARDTKDEAVDWPAWNRKHLPAPPSDLADKAEGRYVDGPALVREALRLAGLDRRTREGRATAEELMQGAPAEDVPDRLAAAIVSRHGLDGSAGGGDAATQLSNLIRRIAVGKEPRVALERAVEQLAAR